MLSLSYNLSSSLKENINNIEDIRRKLLLIPLSPITESRLQWETNLERTYWYLTLRETPINKDDLIKLFSKESNNTLSAEAKSAINYKKVFDYLYLNWLVTNNKVTSKVIKALHKTTSDNSTSKLTIKTEKDISLFLDYLQTGEEHPIIQSGIANIIFSTSSPFNQSGNPTANLIGYLLMYKNGYDFRRLLVMEEFFNRDKNIISRIKSSTLSNQNVTLWLEFYSEGIQIQLSKALQGAVSGRFDNKTSPKNLWKLNKRQKEIVSYLQEPEKKITNKDVQKMFGVSQITASRDLSKLAANSFIFSRGKGRSVFYIKV